MLCGGGHTGINLYHAEREVGIRAEVVVVRRETVGTPPAFAHGVLHILHDEFFRRFCAGESHGHIVFVLELVMNEHIDVLESAVKH